MEVKCKVCGTINDINNQFCKGCFLPLHKTMEEFTKDIEDKVNEDLNKIEVSDETTVLEPIIPMPVKNEKVELDNSSDIVTENPEEIKKIDDLTEILNEEIPQDLNKTIRINTPIDTKEVNDIKDDLRSISIVEEKEETFKENEKSPFGLTLKFDFILIVLSLIFTYFYGIKIDDTTSILYGALSTILFSSIAMFLTFRKDVPRDKDINNTLLLVYVTMILFEVAFRMCLLYISDIAYLYMYIFVNIVYILITIMIVNGISRFIRKNKNNFEPSKFVSKLNLITLFLVILFIGSGLWMRHTQYQIIKPAPEDEVKVSFDLPEELQNYIASINNKILENINNDPNYKIPELIDKTDFVETDLEIESVNLAIDDYGTVSSGEIKYNGVTYRYKA